MDSMYETPVACTKHLKFVPCRRCDDGNDDAHWSSDPMVIDVVRKYELGVRNREWAIAEIARIERLAQ